MAEAEGIPVQHEASSRRTGTDADDIFSMRGGIPCALVSVPLRYMHSPVEMVDLDDIAGTSAGRFCAQPEVGRLLLLTPLTA